MSIRTESIRFNCEKMGNVLLTQNTPIKKGATFPSKIEGCDHSQECGVGLPYSEQKCKSIRNNN